MKPIFNKLKLQKKPVKKELQKILFVPDTHVPYEDVRAWKLMMQAMKEFKPEIIVILGDFLDCYTISDHQKDLKQRPTLGEEIRLANIRLDELDALKAEKKIFIAGNHEFRLDRYMSNDKIREKLLTLEEAGVVKIYDMSHVLGLKQREWIWVPYKEHYKLGKLHITHDCGKAGPMAAVDAESTFQTNSVLGHVHAQTYVIKGNMQGSTHVGASFGWLGDINQMTYMSKSRAMRNWSSGFGYGYMSQDGNTYIVPAPLVNYTVMVEGKLYQG